MNAVCRIGNRGRVILFRGKTKNLDMWICGSLSIGIAGAYYITQDTAGSPEEVIPGTAGQYTGLVDRHGDKIFEGDIVECSKYIGGNWVECLVEKGVVECIDGAFGLYRMYREGERVSSGYYKSFREGFDGWEIEIIGNFHIEPELSYSNW
jgi:uncharacterized phage protein (TIGR01671 family)